MSEQLLKLTTYFGERDRTPHGLLADELLDIYDQARVQTSVLLRGSEGFARLHHQQSDRLLSLSEDLPVVSIALDAGERIESLLEQVVAVKQRGLITLERASLPASPTESGHVSERPHEATKLTVYVGRGERAGGRPAFAAVCDLLHGWGIAGATVLLGVDGSRRGRRARARFFSRNADVPMMIIAVGDGDRIARVLPELDRLLARALLTLERVRICKRDGQRLATPEFLPRADAQGRQLWQKLSVYSSESATRDGRPLHLEIIRRLRAAEAAGATALTGIWGFHGEQPPHGDRLMQIRRHVPVVTVAIDSPEQTARSFQIIDELTSSDGLVTSEMVPAVQALSETGRAGELRLADHRS
jgi:PII-like signaling protein